MNRIWIWGRHPVLEAVRAGSAERVLVARGREPSRVLDQIRVAARDHHITLSEVDLSEIEKLAPGEVTQGVAAQIAYRSLRDVRDLLVGSTNDPAFILALDQIQDPHNLGALLRTANAAGVGGVVVPERHSAPMSGVVAKASAGAMSHTNIAIVPNLVRALDDLRRAGVWVMGLDGDARQSIYGADLTMPVALVLGGEGRGLRRLTREHCDVLLTIPMHGVVENLNASVAGAVVMYEVVRQRTAKRRLE